MNWQPIETAPKDGECYLFFGTWLGNGFPGEGQPAIRIFRWSTLSATSGGEHFWMSDAFISANQYNVKWTHWMPLPPPPDTGAKP